jgi:hypothetical protein
LLITLFSSVLALPSASALELVSDTVLLSSESSHELVSVEFEEGSATTARFFKTILLDLSLSSR